MVDFIMTERARRNEEMCRNVVAKNSLLEEE